MAIASVFLVDPSPWDTIHGILSFVVLGTVSLAIACVLQFRGRTA